MEGLPTPHPKVPGSNRDGVLLLNLNLKMFIRRFKIKLEHIFSKKERWPSGRALVSGPEGPEIDSRSRKVRCVLKRLFLLQF